MCEGGGPVEEIGGSGYNAGKKNGAEGGVGGEQDGLAPGLGLTVGLRLVQKRGTGWRAPEGSALGSVGLDRVVQRRVGSRLSHRSTALRKMSVRPRRHCAGRW